MNAYMWNLEKWHLIDDLTCKTVIETHREQTKGPRGGEREWDERGDWDGHTYTTDTMIKQITNENLLSALW